jgi:hypothetical protein
MQANYQSGGPKSLFQATPPTLSTAVCDFVRALPASGHTGRKGHHQSSCNFESCCKAVVGHKHAWDLLENNHRRCGWLGEQKRRSSLGGVRQLQRSRTFKAKMKPSASRSLSTRFFVVGSALEAQNNFRRAPSGCPLLLNVTGSRYTVSIKCGLGLSALWAAPRLQGLCTRASMASFSRTHR